MLLVCAIKNTMLISFGLYRFMPIMISRMIISLKKVASSRQAHVNVDVSGAFPMNTFDRTR